MVLAKDSRRVSPCSHCCLVFTFLKKLLYDYNHIVFSLKLYPNSPPHGFDHTFHSTYVVSHINYSKKDLTSSRLPKAPSFVLIIKRKRDLFSMLFSVLTNMPQKPFDHQFVKSPNIFTRKGRICSSSHVAKLF